MSSNYFDYSKPLPYWNNQPAPSKNVKFQDLYFPPNENSLIGKNSKGEFVDKIDGKERANRIPVDQLEWKRASEIFKNQKYLLFEGKIEMADINQGSLGDCYFLASAAALSEYPNLIYKMFKTKEVNKEGFFEIVFFIDGKFQVVVVDDYLPVNKKTQQIAFARPNKNEIWVCLLEKAWAKINGGYSNIIKGWMRHVLQTFTGFGFTSFIHTSTSPLTLWKAISNADSNNCIMSSSSRKDVVDKGLVNSHAYTLIGTFILKSKGKEIQMVKMRNTWGFKEWKGDWSDSSPLWGPEERGQVPDFSNKDDGTFYISFDDYFNNFIVTDICFVMYDCHSKSFVIDKTNDNIKHGQVFNIYMEEDGLFTVNLIRKMWRFHRELKNVIIPSFIAIMRYNPDEEDQCQVLSSFQGVYDSYEDVSITKYLKKGFYVIYCYHDYYHSSQKGENFYIVKFDSPAVFKYRYVGNDSFKEGFPFLKKMIVQNVLFEKGEPDESTKVISFVSSYKNSGIGHKLVYNNTDRYVKYTDDLSEKDNMFMLSPYSETNTFDYYIPPHSMNIILGMVHDSKVTKYSFKLSSKSFYVNGLPKNYDDDLDGINIEDYVNTTVAMERIDDFDEYYDYTSMTLQEAKTDLQFEVLDMSEMTIENLLKEEHNIVVKILELGEVRNDKDLSWVTKKYPGGKYIGQVNKNSKREGRGAFIEMSECYIGYWKNDEKNGNGTSYDNAEKLNPIYVGKFKNGKRNGHGKIKFKNGDSYEGNFSNNVREGRGVYYFKSGSSWEGNFDNDKMDGDGIFKKGGKNLKVRYVQGKLVK